jgi:DNA-binding transcriptional ArsR family regulator
LLNYHRTAVAPFWRTVRDEVARERARAATLLANGGTEALLTGLSPLLRWHDPILEAAPVGEALHPNGRGLLLAPSYFCQDAPITLVRQETMPVLVFPVAHTLALVRDEVLPDLLGRSRATLLEVAADGGSTSELARRAGVLVSSASQHLTVLRRAGLVMSRREANAVIHQVTPLGVSLLRGDQSPQQV